MNETKETMYYMEFFEKLSRKEPVNWHSPSIPKYAQIPIGLRDTTWNDLRGEYMKEVKNILLPYLTNIKATFDAGTSFYLWGPFGNAKSAMAAVILQMAASTMPYPNNMLKYFSVYFASVQDLLQLRKPWIDESEQQDEMDKIRDIDFLVIDDIHNFIVETAGMEEVNINKIAELLAYRYAQSLPTIITGNLKPEALEAKFGKAIGSRLAEKYVSIEFTGMDYRKNVLAGTKMVLDTTEKPWDREERLRLENEARYKLEIEERKRQAAINPPPETPAIPRPTPF